MDRSAVKAIVDREIEPLMLSLGIPHWHIVVTYEPNGPAETGWTRRARVDIKPGYNRASIEFNPEAFDDDDGIGVVKTLRHELLHVVLAPYDVFRDAAGEALGDDDSTARVLKVVWTHAIEKAVINLERMFSQLTNEAAEKREKAEAPSEVPGGKAAKPRRKR